MLILKNKKKWFTALFSLFILESVFAQKTDKLMLAVAKRTEMWLDVGYYLLILLVTALVIAVVGKLLKLYELTVLIGKSKKAINWNFIHGILFLLALFIGLGAAIWEINVHGGRILYAYEAASEHGAEVDKLVKVTFFITFFVFLITHILLFSFAFIYRYGEQKKAHYYPHNDKLEVVWTVIPAIVLAILVFFGWKAWTDITSPAEKYRNALRIAVVAEQFKWTVQYPGKDGVLGARNYRLIGGVNILGVDFKDPVAQDDFFPTEIVLPVDKPIQMIFGAKDVIHSALIPHFRVQMNCVPGMPTYFSFTPTITTAQMRSNMNDPHFEYLLYCNKVCGSSHFNMKFVVKIVSQREYNEWLLQQSPFYPKNLAIL